MKRIDTISQLEKKCTGCMACVDICPVGCVTVSTGKDGFMYSSIDESKCIACGKCYSVCPIETHEKHQDIQHLVAAYSKDPIVQKNGSSGGVFELLAKHFVRQGYYICGAAFDGMILKHRVVAPGGDIRPLLKSKYIQSNMKGIYTQLIELLKRGEKVFFCGTPCQVSALINTTPEYMRENLFVADFICHGVPSQKVFDAYIETLEKKQGGRICEFSFRVKDNGYRHAHGYSYKVVKDGKVSVVNDIYTNSSFYNAFKKYLIFRDSCYDCQYTTLQRVSDITLADFWGIEKYDFKGNVDSGVSMIITNTEKGRTAFSAIEGSVVCKELPVQYGIDSNYCLTHTTKKPKDRDKIMEEMVAKGYEKVAKKYFGCSMVYKVYWLIPPKVRDLIRRMRGN